MLMRRVFVVVLSLVLLLAFAATVEAKGEERPAKEKKKQDALPVVPTPLEPSASAPLSSPSSGTASSTPDASVPVAAASATARPEASRLPREPPFVAPVPRDAPLAEGASTSGPAPHEAVAFATAPSGSVEVASNVPLSSAPRWAVPLVGAFAVGAVAAGVLGMRSRPVPTPTSRSSLVVSVDDVATAAEALAQAKVFAAEGRWAQALVWFDRAVVLEPELAVAHFVRGLALTALGQRAEARDAFEAALVRDPAEGAYRLYLARAHASLGESRDATRVVAPLVVAMPELVDTLRKDDAFVGLHDHPMFLAAVGAL